MNRKNNIIISILGLVCVISMLSACSRITDMINPTKESTSQATIEETSSEAETSKDDIVTQETSTDSPERAEQDDMKLLSLSTSRYDDYKYDETISKYLYEVSVQGLHLNNKSVYGDAQLMAEDCPKLNDVLESFDDDQKQQAINWSGSLDEEINTDIEYKGADDFATYEYKTETLVQRSDANVLSFLSTTYTYQGGAHGFTMYVGYNYDTQTGENIELADVINNTDMLSTVLHDKLVKKYSDMLFEDPKATVDSMIAENILYWTLGYDGITCYFNQYDIAPYAAGMLSVHIGFADYPDLFSKHYMEIPDRYAFQLSDYEVYHIDVDGDGTEESLMQYYNEDEYGTRTSLVLSVDGESDTTDCFCYDTTSVYVHMPDGKNYIYINTSEDNDYQSIYVFEVSKTPKFIDSIGNLGLSRNYNQKTDRYDLSVLTDPDMFRLESSGNLICTGSIYKTYHVGDDGKPQSDDEEYEFSDKSYQITSKIPLLLTDTDGQKAALPAGTVFDVLSTDNETYAKLGLGSKIYMLPVDQSNGETWYRKVDGKNLEDVFDGIFFAG